MGGDERKSLGAWEYGQVLLFGMASDVHVVQQIESIRCYVMICCMSTLAKIADTF